MGKRNKNTLILESDAEEAPWCAVVRGFIAFCDVYSGWKFRQVDGVQIGTAVRTGS